MKFFRRRQRMVHRTGEQWVEIYELQARAAVVYDRWAGASKAES